MINNKINVIEFIQDKIWFSKYTYFRKIYQSMWRDNKIDWNCTWLKVDAIKRLRADLHKHWFIRKIKWDWYVNPYLVNKDNKKNKELEELFSKNKAKNVDKDVQEFINKIM